MLLPLTLVAGSFTFLVLVNDWFEGSVLIFEGRGSYESTGVDVSLADVDRAWADVYRFAAPLLVLVVVVVLAGPARLRRGAALTATALIVVTGIALSVGWVDVGDAVREYEADAREIASRAPPGYVNWSTTSLPRIFAAVALAILAVVTAIVVLGMLRPPPPRTVTAPDRRTSP